METKKRKIGKVSKEKNKKVSRIKLLREFSKVRKEKQSEMDPKALAKLVEKSTIKSYEDLHEVLQRCNEFPHQSQTVNSSFEKSSISYTAFLDYLLNIECVENLDDLTDGQIIKFLNLYYVSEKARPRNYAVIIPLLHTRKTIVMKHLQDLKENGGPGVIINPNQPLNDFVFRKLDGYQSSIFSKKERMQVVPKKILVSIYQENEELFEEFIKQQSVMFTLKTIATKWLFKKFFPSLNWNALSYTHGIVHLTLKNLLNKVGKVDDLAVACKIMDDYYVSNLKHCEPQQRKIPTSAAGIRRAFAILEKRKKSTVTGHSQKSKWYRKIINRKATSSESEAPSSESEGEARQSDSHEKEAEETNAPAIEILPLQEYDMIK